MPWPGLSRSNSAFFSQPCSVEIFKATGQTPSHGERKNQDQGQKIYSALSVSLLSLSLPPRFSLFLAQLQGQHVTNKCIHSLFVSASGLRGETRGWGALVRAARSTGLISPDEKVKCSFSPSPFHQTVSGWPTFTAPATVLCLCLCLVQKCDSTGERIYLYTAGKNALIMGVIDLISILVCLHNVS